LYRIDPCFAEIRIILALSFLREDHPRMILPGKRRGKDDPFIQQTLVYDIIHL